MSQQSPSGNSSTEHPQVSVVIPAYNHEQFVDEAIASVIAQTSRRWEMVIVDDGSSDGTRRHCEVWAARDSRIRLVCQPNGGSHAAINRGVAETSAPVVMVLNSDDRWDAHRVQRLMREFEDPQATFVVSAVQLIDASGSIIEDKEHWWIRTQRDFLGAVRRWGNWLGLLYGNYTVSTSNFAFRRSLWDAVGPVRPRKLIPDWDWALRAALHNPAGMRFLSEEALLHYRLHGSNAILSQVLRGALEINRLHHWALAQLDVPASVRLSLFRNQRDLRRHSRRLGLEAGETAVREQGEELERLRLSLHEASTFVQAREADVAALQERLEQTERFVHAREADVAALQERLEQTEHFVHAREADVAALRERLEQTEHFVRAREADVAALHERLEQTEHFVHAREADVAALQERLEQTEHFVHAREADVAALQERLARIEASWWWNAMLRLQPNRGRVR